MKKITLLLLISSLLLAQSKIYLGTGYGYNQEDISYNGSQLSVNNNAARVKIGYGDREAYAVELSFDYVDNNKEIFGPDDGQKYGFNVELLKAFDFGIYVNPFFKAGFGAGYLNTPEDVTNGSLTYGTFNLGTGLFIPINEHFDIEVAYEFKNVSYQKLGTNLTYSPSSTLHIGYVGVNFRF
ncbi:MAG: outer membrane beta-barrel protein [Epsilonproteobacteria bacterium]|nr:outer membrane beta-barrel protein [Campylobacterota bacterium]